MTTVTAGGSGRHVLTVGLEDYFQGTAFRDVVDRRRWSRFETRFDKNTLATLDLLDRHKAKATFFVMSSVAEKCAEVIREAVRRGHEIASAGSSARSFRQLAPAQFREELRKSKAAIEAASGQRVRGFRSADRHLSPKDLWALEVLAEEGYEYDSSLSPSQWHFRKQDWRRFVHQERFGERVIWEFPLSSLSVAGCMLPIAGGNYFRQFPRWLMQAAVRRWTLLYDQPFVMYFRIWDLDPEQPRITAAPLLARIRHYRNGEKMPEMLAHFLGRYRFTSIEKFLDLRPSPLAEIEDRSLTVMARLRSRDRQGADVRESVSVVVPCFNEELVLSYLKNTLGELDQTLGERYAIEYIFVDDGSSDGTLATLRNLFGASGRHTVLAHEKNQGVAAAIQTGIRSAKTPIVCSIDCDCTYDPRELRNMIPLLTDGVDLVTASPYHPAGSVVNVPGWRLALSKTASWMYRAVLRQSLHTYTSCFRVYRRDAVLRLELRETGFLGVAELLGEMALRGSRIVEYPATLETRMLGRSKMRIAGTLLGHLRLMARFALRRRERRERHVRQPAQIEPKESTEVIKT